MITISSSAQLRSCLADLSQQVCNEVIDRALELLKDCIEEIVYAEPNKGGYVRTMQFEELAWDTLKHKLNAYVAQSELYYNPLNYKPADPIKSRDAHKQAEQLASLIIKGYHAYGDGLFVEGRDYWTPFKTKLNAQWDGWVREAYRKRGLMVY